MTGFRLTPRQHALWGLMSSDATHVMAYGGSRSGKTFAIIRAIMMRALAHESRHGVFRFRFNHVKNSIVYDTLPKVVNLCWPGLSDHCKLNKEDWFYRLPNGSEIWFGGLDDKERTEKILGQEFSTIFLNECSQIPWSSRNMAMTRLAQKTPLRLKAFYDCNPPGKSHWTYRLFIERASPDTRKALADPYNYAAMVLNPADNQENLSSEYLRQLEAMPEKVRKRFLDGQFADMTENALWSIELLEQCRIDGDLPDMQRIVVAVDPSGTSGNEDDRSDEIGIVVAGLGVDGNGYVLEDLSGKYSPSVWGRLATEAFDRHEADCIVAETNYGGAMVGEIIRAARPGTPFREVHATRGKVVRAEPVAVLFQQGRIVMAGAFPELEDQLCAMTTAGYVGSKSPDRADAMVWALSSLFPQLTKKERTSERALPTTANLGRTSQKQARAGRARMRG